MAYYSLCIYIRGEVSEATQTYYVAGARDICVSSPWANHSTRNADVVIYFLLGKETPEKKDLLLWSGFEPGSDQLTDNCLHHPATGAVEATRPFAFCQRMWPCETK